MCTSTATSTNDVRYYLPDFHNALFATVLSGCAGAITSYDNLITSDFGFQTLYFKPLVNFLSGEDLNLDNCVVICNPCPNENSYTSFDNYNGAFPREYPNQDLAFVINSKITASGYVYAGIKDFFAVEVFALQYNKGVNEGKIIGWVKNRNNWWYNIRHDNVNCIVPDADPHFPCFNPNLEVTAEENFAQVQTVYDVEITIPDACNGTYRIDFYSVYPDWPLTGNNIPENGGIIGSIIVNTSCNSLTFKVPGALVVLKFNNGPCAPDYGFKATPIIKTWGYGFLGAGPTTLPITTPVISGLQPFSIGEDGKLIACANYIIDSGFFSIGGLEVYTRDSLDVYSWSKKSLASINSAFIINMNDCVIALGSQYSQIYYKGNDSLLQCAFLVGTSWEHGILNSGTDDEKIGGDIGCAAVGGTVFFRSQNGDMHIHYFGYKSGAWGWWHQKYISTNFLKGPAGDTNFAVNEDGSIVAYKCVDGSINVLQKSTPGIYNSIPGIPIVDAKGIIRINYAGDVIFYLRESGSYLSFLYKDGSGWSSGDISIAGCQKIPL